MTIELGDVCDNASGLKGWKVSLAPYKEPFCLRRIAANQLGIWQFSNCNAMLKFFTLLLNLLKLNFDFQAKMYAYWATTLSAAGIYLALHTIRLHAVVQ